MVYSLTIIFICSDICQSLWTSETNGSEAEFNSFYKALGAMVRMDVHKYEFGASRFFGLDLAFGKEQWLALTSTLRCVCVGLPRVIRGR